MIGTRRTMAMVSVLKRVVRAAKKLATRAASVEKIPVAVSRRALLYKTKHHTSGNLQE